jgi:tRNA dimethylallyltransferase
MQVAISALSSRLAAQSIIMDLIKNIQDFISKAQRPILGVVGPTASGKTALSLYLAKQFEGEILSTDSRQIYQEMPIGTDAISEEEQGGVPHHLLGLRTPDKTLTLAEYKDDALEKIEEIYAKKHLPMLVGGTGLYIEAIIDNYDMPRVPPNPELRAQLEKEVAEKGPEHLHAKLQKLDPEAAKSIHQNNIRYVIRAIEINLATDLPKPDAKLESEFDSFFVGVEWPREELYARIGIRVERQLERGLVEEVRGLLDRGYDENLPSMSSLGVKEIIPFIRGESSLEECVEVLKRNTRRYAKRQMTWFRRYDHIVWLTPEQLSQYE